MLKNVIYIGKVNYLGKEIHDGEHEAIIDDDVWSKAQEYLKHKMRPDSHASLVPRRNPAVLALRMRHDADAHDQKGTAVFQLCMRIAILSPEIIHKVIQGEASAMMTVEFLRSRLPVLWDGQMTLLFK